MDEKTNWRYLGPSNFPQWSLRLLPFSKRFDKAAKKHDEGYWLGGTNVEKKYTDDMFAKDMITVCNWNPFSWFFAFVYYLAVKTLGFMFFNWKTTEVKKG